MNSAVVEICGDNVFRKANHWLQNPKMYLEYEEWRHPLGRALTNGRVKRSQISMLEFRAGLEFYQRNWKVSWRIKAKDHFYKLD